MAEQKYEMPNTNHGGRGYAVPLTDAVKGAVQAYRGEPLSEGRNAGLEQAIGGLLALAEQIKEDDPRAANLLRAVGIAYAGDALGGGAGAVCYAAAAAYMKDAGVDVTPNYLAGMQNRHPGLGGKFGELASPGYRERECDRSCNPHYGA